MKQPAARSPRPPTRLPALVAGAMAAVLAALALGLGFAVAPAGAHSGSGTLTVEQAHPATLSVHYIVRLTWDNDGHPADDATVTATPVSPDGVALTPFTLAPSGAGDGRYSGAVEFPEAGAWTVRFTSIEPTGSVDHPEQVAAEPDAEASGDGGSATTEGGFAAADDGTGASAEPAGGSEDDDGGIPVPLVVGAAVVALAGVVSAVLAIRRYRPDLQSGPSGDEPGAGGGAAGGPGASDDDAGASDAAAAGDDGGEAGATGPERP